MSSGAATAERSPACSTGGTPSVPTFIATVLRPQAPQSSSIATTARGGSGAPPPAGTAYRLRVLAGIAARCAQGRPRRPAGRTRAPGGRAASHGFSRRGCSHPGRLRARVRAFATRKKGALHGFQGRGDPGHAVPAELLAAVG